MSKEHKDAAKPQLPPALERKLQRRAKTGRFTPAPRPQAPRGGPAKRAVRHQGR
jgi:hypothetical protein